MILDDEIQWQDTSPTDPPPRIQINQWRHDADDTEDVVNLM